VDARRSARGTGPGLSTISLGEVGGVESTTLTIPNMPAHSHNIALKAEAAAGTSANPTNNLPDISTNQDRIYAASTPGVEIAMHPDSITQGAVGGNQPFTNRPPYLGVNCIICLFGIFPSRNGSGANKKACRIVPAGLFVSDVRRAAMRVLHRARLPNYDI
jgi:microcystin-dependent protein